MSMSNQPGTPRDDSEMGGNFLNPFQSESVSISLPGLLGCKGEPVSLAFCLEKENVQVLWCACAQWQSAQWHSTALCLAWFLIVSESTELIWIKITVQKRGETGKGGRHRFTAETFSGLRDQWKSRVYTEVCDESTSRFYVAKMQSAVPPIKGKGSH